MCVKRLERVNHLYFHKTNGGVEVCIDSLKLIHATLIVSNTTWNGEVAMLRLENLIIFKTSCV